MTMYSNRRVATTLVVAALGLALVVAAAVAAGRPAADRTTLHGFTAKQARGAAPLGKSSADRLRATTAWCGAPATSDLVPNALAGHPVHWIYMTPLDEADQLGAYASVMQSDAEAIDGWWRAQDSTRSLRNDVAPFSCGAQLDLTTIRLGQPGAALASVEARPDIIANALLSAGFNSRHNRYLVYYDGPVELEICGQGGTDDSGVGFAFVYVRACPGVPFATTAAHELMHAMGAVPEGAPSMCPPPGDGHVCDDPYDMMFPFGDETPIGGLILDSGRNDYYGHSGSWLDIQDQPWLLQLDRQAPLTLTMSGPGKVVADLPGLSCTKTCTTTWNANTPLTLTATPEAGAKLVRWGSACSGAGPCSVTVANAISVSVLFAPPTYRLTAAVSGKGTVRSSRPGISCPKRCAASLPSHEPLQLTARAGKGWRFKSWNGACRGTRPTCTVPMTGDASARALFVRA